MTHNELQAKPASSEGYLQCPRCSEHITDVLQALTGWAALIDIGPNVSVAPHAGLMRPLSIDSLEFEYAGETEIIWDSLVDHPESLVRCSNGHVSSIKSCTFIRTTHD